MRALLLSVILTFVAGTAFAATLACEVPTANVVRSIELCEELRLRLRVRASEWNTDVCATEFLRRGLIAGEKQVTKSAFNTTVNAVVGDAVNDFTSTWPAPTRAFCGDGTLDTEDIFGPEECDDGNDVDGDGCSSCRIDP
jgi:cysteine-rich repeat protein